MLPAWLTELSEASLALAGLFSLVVLVDVVRHPQKMAIMNVVWPITPLYLGPLGLWAYLALGRVKNGGIGEKAENKDGQGQRKGPS